MALIRPILSLAVLLFAIASHGETQAGAVWNMQISGAIGPATADYVARGIGKAAEAHAQLVVLNIDTPGGLDKAMRTIVKAVLDSPVPVACFVSPSGARAASAGTYILYACHIAAMAPGTNLGAATPVQISAPSAPSQSPEEEKTAQSAMEKKMVNDAVAYIQGLATLRDRNAEWAEQAVREGASLSASAALEKNVIDLMADNFADLLAQIEGREVSLADATRALKVVDAPVVQHEPDWRSEFLSVITNPEVAYILFLVGIYGLIIEFSNPGMLFPGILGAIALLLALYAFQVLPVSYVGVALILLGIGLMAAEVYSPSFGALGIGGIVAFIIGSIVLMDTELPAYRIALPVIVAVSAFSAGVVFVVLRMALRAYGLAPVSGLQHLVGSEARVERVSDGVPMVHLDGELWQVNCPQPLAVSDRVKVTGARGVVLDVSRIDEGEPS